MTALAIARPSPSGLLAWLLLAAVVGVGILLGAPLTRHAADSHLAQWNATSISQVMRAGTCKPIQVWVCAPAKQIKALCQMKPGVDLWLGLVVGTADPANLAVITGYAARWSYWAGTLTRDGCLPTVVAP
jgi:hypothetical protein